MYNRPTEEREREALVQIKDVYMQWGIGELTDEQAMEKIDGIFAEFQVGFELPVGG